MEDIILPGGAYVFLFAAAAFGNLVTKVRCTAAEVGSRRWQYVYDITKVSSHVLMRGVCCG